VPTNEPDPPARAVPRPNVAFLTMAVGRRVRTRVDAALAAHGLTYRHLSALGHLARNPDLSYAELARRSSVTNQSMQATLAQLQARGAVEQRNEAKRGLRAQLRVTPTGLALLRTGTTVMDDVEGQLLAGLPADQVRVLGPALLALFTGMVSSETDEAAAAGGGERAQ
jgi:DNA-binding MarR family transcriptional regulator